jgi:phosphatidylserine decarboxylase
VPSEEGPRPTGPFVCLNAFEGRLQYPQMRIDSAGLPFIGGAVLVAAIAFAAGYHVVALLCFVLAIFFLFFFRDPERKTKAGPDDVISPADGRVMIVAQADEAAAPPGTWQQISIFLSPADVHVNRIPVTGRIARVVRVVGVFLPAYRPDAASRNDRTEIWIDRGGQTVICRQVVGILARRIVCRVTTGQQVQAGERYGIMKFGSRIDLFLPPGGKMFVRVGERVLGGVTRLATLPPVGGTA